MMTMQSGGLLLRRVSPRCRSDRTSTRNPCFEKIEVAAGVVSRSAGVFFERGVFEGPLGAFPVVALVFSHPGQSEVDQLRHSLAAHEDVGHLQVAVRRPAAEGVVETFGHVEN